MATAHRLTCVIVLTALEIDGLSISCLGFSYYCLCIIIYDFCVCLEIVLAFYVIAGALGFMISANCCDITIAIDMERCSC